MAPALFVGLATVGPLSPIIRDLQGENSARHRRVNARMATGEAGKGKKGKNFSADEERALCRSFLAVSQDPVCGNGQRNTTFWERITTNYNANKPRSCPIRPARSLESKWSHIKHDVAKFSGVFKQVSDCRESGASAEDVLERALEFYKDRHPKQQGFVFLHCWHLLKEVPRWWQSPQDIQRRGSGGGAASQVAMSNGTANEQQGGGQAKCGDAGEEDDVQVVQKPNLPSRPTRPQGTKAAKVDLLEQTRRDSILRAQALATEQMAKANMRKAEAMGDHAAMSLFRMPIAEVDEEAHEYFKLRRKEEMERIKRRMEQEQRVAEREKMEHEKLVAERVAEDHRTKRPRVQLKTPVQTEPTNPAEPTMEPNVGCSDATPTPPTPGPLPTAEEDSPVQPEFGEFLFLFFCRV
jgi:hypothetical protein